MFARISGGGSGIRTHGTLSRTHPFQACALSRSAISPARRRSLPDVPRQANPFLASPATTSPRRSGQLSKSPTRSGMPPTGIPREAASAENCVTVVANAPDRPNPRSRRFIGLGLPFGNTRQDGGCHSFWRRFARKTRVARRSDTRRAIGCGRVYRDRIPDTGTDPTRFALASGQT